MDEVPALVEPAADAPPVPPVPPDVPMPELPASAMPLAFARPAAALPPLAFDGEPSLLQALPFSTTVTMPTQISAVRERIRVSFTAARPALLLVHRRVTEPERIGSGVGAAPDAPLRLDLRSAVRASELCRAMSRSYVLA
jgi:hypothetical protein